MIVIIVMMTIVCMVFNYYCSYKERVDYLKDRGSIKNRVYFTEITYPLKVMINKACKYIINF